MARLGSSRTARPASEKVVLTLVAPARQWTFPGRFRVVFDGKEDAKKFFYMYENVVMTARPRKRRPASLSPFSRQTPSTTSRKAALLLKKRSRSSL